jgi:hypothetical protein
VENFASKRKTETIVSLMPERLYGKDAMTNLHKMHNITFMSVNNLLGLAFDGDTFQNYKDTFKFNYDFTPIEVKLKKSTNL